MASSVASARTSGLESRQTRIGKKINLCNRVTIMFLASWDRRFCGLFFARRFVGEERPRFGPKGLPFFQFSEKFLIHVARLERLAGRIGRSHAMLGLSGGAH